MDDTLKRRVEAHVRAGQYADALPLVREAINTDPSDANAWYLAGQCCRFLNDLDGAIEHLTKAAILRGDDPAIYLALGIAYQLESRFDEAVSAFRDAIEQDQNYDLAYNSLALTQKKMGDLDRALHTYDAGAKAITRGIVDRMQRSNRRSSRIYKHRDMIGDLWLGYAAFGAVYSLQTNLFLGSVAFPGAAMAEDEERSERHGGLYWIDSSERLFLPNYFNTFRKRLRRSGYSNIIGNRGTALDVLGKTMGAEKHFNEAREFSLRRPNLSARIGR